MSTATAKYFNSVSLTQRYINVLDEALQSHLLQAQTHLWLKGVVDPSRTGDLDPVRVDRIRPGEGVGGSSELSTALLLSHGRTDDPNVYLYTLGKGLEAYEDRRALLAALREQFAGQDANAVFEAEKIDGDPFLAQALSIIDYQVENMRRLTAQLKLMPRLSSAVTASLDRQLLETFPHMTLDAETHLVQVVRVAEDDAESTLITEPLALAAFNDYCHMQVDAEAERRFLDDQGRIVDAAQAALFSEALANALPHVADDYAKLLDDFWKDECYGQLTRRDLAIERFGDSLRHEFYSCLHDGTLDGSTLKSWSPLMRSSSGDLSTSPMVRCYQLVIRVGVRAPYSLAGSFVAQSQSRTDDELVWFAPGHKCLKFTDTSALDDHLHTEEGRARLRPALALEDQSALRQPGTVRVELEEILDPLFTACVDSIIALQRRNLAYVLALPDKPEELSAKVDDALDVRQLLDPSQLQLSAGRWRRDAPFDFANVWPASGPVAADSQPSSTLTSSSGAPREAERSDGTQAKAILSSPWRELAQAFESRAEHLMRSGIALIEHAEQAMQPYLCVLVGSPVEARDLQVQWLESTPGESSDVEVHAVPVSESQVLESMSLVSVLLECVSGHRSRILGSGARVRIDPASSVGLVQIDLINHVLERVATNFTEHYLSHFDASQVQLQRQGDQHWCPFDEALSIREDAIRLDLAWRRRLGKINSAAFDMTLQVLNRPVRYLRMAPGEPMTEAFSVALSFGENAAMTLCETLVLRQPLDPLCPVMVWYGATGWQQFSSIEQWQAGFLQDLHHTNTERLLALVGETTRPLLRAHLLKTPDSQAQIQLKRVDGHVIEEMQRELLDHQKQALRHLCLRATRCRFEAGLFTGLANDAERDLQLREMLDELWVKINNSIFEAMLPSWIATASVEDLKLYYTIIKQFYLMGDGGKDFLFNIPALTVYARERLVEQLRRDFRDQVMNPDRITVTSRCYVSAFPAPGELPSAVAAATIVRSESLTDFAINRLADTQDVALSVDSEEQPLIRQLLTPDYLRQLVRTLDIGTGYRTLLRRAFAPDDEDYSARKRLFFQQLPSALLAAAMPEKMKGKLSLQGFELITRVLEMPDGIARGAAGEEGAFISPLRLVADTGMTPDTVTGIYLIGPAAPAIGPVVLYAIYHPAFAFREYDSPSKVMDDIRNDELLQALLLERLDPEVRRRYAHGGFSEPHLPFSVEGLGEVPLRAPGPVTLNIAPIQGNALLALFNGALKVLLDLGVSNSVTNDQADQAGRTFLATLALSQVLTLLPSKLAALVTLWQSHTLLHASAVSVTGHRWGEALSEFCAALGVMTTAREQALEEHPNEDGARAELASGADEEQGLLPTFSWRGTALNAEQRIRLHELEAQNVALDEMRHDKLLNLYRDKHAKPYAVVAGKVYEVRNMPEEGKWMIVGADGTPGPKLVLDSNQRWELDLTLRLRGGGGLITKFEESSASAAAEENIIIEASGMPKIRLFFRERARRIGEAHLKAKSYLENCLDNLNTGQHAEQLDPQVEKVIGDFFGTAKPDSVLVRRVEQVVRALLDAVMDGSLSPYSSPRFVVGFNRPGQERVTAFVIAADPQRRVFLTERFFRVPNYQLKPDAAAQGFELRVHFQATTLIHELSHQVLDTKDIAYVESTAPYPDLLRGNTAANLKVRSQIERLHEHRLSHRTPKNDLFKQNDNGQWRDVTREDVLGYSTILRITGAKNLDEARSIFLSDVHKRSQIMLKNADSVALMVARLGRRNFATPSP